MIPLVVIVVLGALLTGWPDPRAAAESPCENLPAGSLSRMECERNAAKEREQKRAPESVIIGTIQRPPGPAVAEDPIITECGLPAKGAELVWAQCKKRVEAQLEKEEREYQRTRPKVIRCKTTQTRMAPWLLPESTTECREE